MSKKICVLVSKQVLLDYAIWRALVDKEIQKIEFVFFDFESFLIFSDSKVTHKALHSSMKMFTKGLVLPFGCRPRDLPYLASYVIAAFLKLISFISGDSYQKIKFYLKILAVKRYSLDEGFDEVWLSWSKKTKVERILLNMLSKNGIRCHFVPDALVAELYTMGQAQDEVISKHRPFFVVHHEGLAESTIANKEVPKEQLILKQFSCPQITKPVTRQKQFNILFLAQKTVGEEWEATNTASQISRIQNLYSVINKLGLNENVKFFYRQRPLKEHDDNIRKIKAFCGELNLHFVDANNHSLFDCILSSDFVISEFTSAFVYSRGMPVRFMYMDQSFAEATRRFPIVKSQYYEDLEAGAIVDESAILNSLTNELQTYQGSQHIILGDH